jgi:glyoxylase-like metal-dependent hydrolase (beta-lactamase superfamily II)
MSLARITHDIFEINLRYIKDYNIYLVRVDDDNNFALINSGNGNGINYIVSDIMEILKRKDKLKYIILTTNDERLVNGTVGLYNIFKSTYIVSHRLYSTKLRRGEGINENFSPFPISLEIDEKCVELGRIKLRVVKSDKSFHMIVSMDKVLITGAIVNISPLKGYTVCSIEGCIRE